MSAAQAMPRERDTILRDRRTRQALAPTDRVRRPMRAARVVFSFNVASVAGTWDAESSTMLCQGTGMWWLWKAVSGEAVDGCFKSISSFQGLLGIVYSI